MFTGLEKRIVRKLFVLIFIAISFLPLAGKDSSFLESYRRESKKRSLNLLVYFYREGCQYCSHMDTYVLSEPEVDALIKDNFVFAALNLDKKEVREVGNEYRIFATPSFLFLSPSGVVLHAHSGSMELENFIQMLKKYSKSK